MCSGVTCGPGRRETSSPSTSAIAARPGTWSRISRPESAGTAAPVAGSSRIEMVPPVKRMGTTRSRAAGRLPVEELAVLLLLHVVDGGDVRVGGLLDLVQRAALV